jgi:hypothetical protein
MLGITYSEFDNIVGPKLEYAYPSGVLSADTFETLSDYAIVGSHLSKKSIVVKTADIQFLSYSVAINNPKYFRNTLLFSCGVVLERDAVIEPYEPLLRKLSSSLVALELEQEFLFKKNIKDMRLPQLLKDIFDSCKIHGEAFVEIDSANYLAIKLFSPVVQPRQIQEYEVPMLLYDTQLTANLPWDITLHHILPMIDGINYIKRIAELSVMDVDTVTKAVRTLLFYNCIIVTDIFRFNNVYQLYPDASRRLLNEPNILQEIEQFAIVLPYNIHDYDDEDKDEPIRQYVEKPSSYISTSEGGVSNRDMSRNVSFEAVQVEYQSNDATDSVDRTTNPSQNHFNHCDNTRSNMKKIDDLPSRIPGILRFLLRLRPDRTIAHAIFGENYQNNENMKNNNVSRKHINLSKHLVNIDIRRLVAIAQEKKIIQRLYEFPVRGGVRADLSKSTIADSKNSTTNITMTDFEVDNHMKAVGKQVTSINSDSVPTSNYPYGEFTDDDYEDIPSQSVGLDLNNIEVVSGDKLASAHSAFTTSGRGFSRKVSVTKDNKDLIQKKDKKISAIFTNKSRKKTAATLNSQESDDDDYLFMADDFLRSDGEKGVSNKDYDDVRSDSGASDSEDSRESRSSKSTNSNSEGSSSSDESSSEYDSDHHADDYYAIRGYERKQQEQKLINGLNGADSLDAICCAHQLTPSAVLDASHMFIPYKASRNR